MPAETVSLWHGQLSRAQPSGLRGARARCPCHAIGEDEKYS
jgi:hypothetical protein